MSAMVGIRALAKVVLALIAAATCLYFLLPLAGFRVIRDRAITVHLEGSEIEQTQQAHLVEPSRKPKNLVIFVGDGLGFAHLSAGRAALHGVGGSVAWDRFPVTGWHRSHPAEGFIVDSAASATALATGVPTRNGAVSIDMHGSPLETLFERATALGYRTGLVTDSYVWDATPAAFATHASSRDDAESILRQLADSSVEILVGELRKVGGQDIPEWQDSVRILGERFLVHGPESEGTEDFLRDGRTGDPIAAIYEEGQIDDLQSSPTLLPFVVAALERLSSDERPFLLLVESEEPDTSSHRQDFNRLLKGIEVIEAALTVILDFADRDPETLVVFTADHETGGLTLTSGDRENSSLKAVWSTWGHTGTVIPVLAQGPGSESFAGSHATWQVGRLLTSMLREPGELDEALPHAFE